MSPGRQGRGRDDLQVFKPGPGFFVTLDPTAAKCASADPAIRPLYWSWLPCTTGRTPSPAGTGWEGGLETPTWLRRWWWLRMEATASKRPLQLCSRDSSEQNVCRAVTTQRPASSGVRGAPGGRPGAQGKDTQEAQFERRTSGQLTLVASYASFGSLPLRRNESRREDEGGRLIQQARTPARSALAGRCVYYHPPTVWLSMDHMASKTHAGSHKRACCALDSPGSLCGRAFSSRPLPQYHAPELPNLKGDPRGR